MDFATERHKSLQKNKRKNAYWWNEKIWETRNQCIRKRRIMMRLRKKGNIEEVRKINYDYRQLRSMLKIQIKKAKNKAWGELLTNLDNDM